MHWIQPLFEHCFLTDQDIQFLHQVLAGLLLLFFFDLFAFIAYVDEGGHQRVSPAFNNDGIDLLVRAQPNSSLGVRIAKVDG